MRRNTQVLSHLSFQELLQAHAQHLPEETIIIEQRLMQQTSKSFIIRNSHRSLLRQRGCIPLPILEERWPFRLHRQILTHHEFTDKSGRRQNGCQFNKESLHPLAITIISVHPSG